MAQINNREKARFTSHERINKVYFYNYLFIAFRAKVTKTKIEYYRRVSRQLMIIDILMVYSLIIKKGIRREMIWLFNFVINS